MGETTQVNRLLKENLIDDHQNQYIKENWNKAKIISHKFHSCVIISNLQMNELKPKNVTVKINDKALWIQHLNMIFLCCVILVKRTFEI